MRLARSDMGLKQETVAQRIGVSRSFMSLIENGHLESDLKLGIIEALADELKVSPAYLAGWTSDPLNGERGEDVIDAVNVIMGVFPEHRHVLREYLRLDLTTQELMAAAMFIIVAKMIELIERHEP